MQAPAVLKAHLEASLGWRARVETEYAPSGIAELELPRGAITDVYGPRSSGRTSLLVSALAEATARQEVCALIDSSNAFDPASADAAGADLARLLWIRCGGRPDRALKAADLLIQAGGFGLVALDLGDVAPAVSRRIPLASWYRFRRAIENTPTVLLVLEQEPSVKNCASLILDLRRRGIAWSGAAGCSQLLRGLRVEAAPRKPVQSQTVAFDAKALA